MGQAAPSRFWRISRRLCRWFFITGLLLILGVVSFGLFLNRVGLPEFLKERIVARLKAQGWAVEFSQMRFTWQRVIVARDLHLRRIRQPGGPQLFLDKVECRLNRAALKKLEVEVDSVMLEGGRLVWPLASTHRPATALQLNDAAGELLFRTGDQWELRSLHASLLGTRLQLSGVISNASRIRDWRFPRVPERTGVDPEALWRETVAAVNRIKYSGTPVLSGDFRGDARNFRSFDARLTFQATALRSPWGSGTNVLLSARLFPPATSNGWVQADLQLAADLASTPWGQARTFRLNLGVEPSLQQWIPTNALLALDLKEAQARWGSAEHLVVTARFNSNPTNALLMQSDLTASGTGVLTEVGRSARAKLDATFVHSLTNLWPASVSAELQLEETGTRWGRARRANLRARGVLPPTNDFTLLRTNLSWPERFQNVYWSAQAALTEVTGPQIQAEQLVFTTEWSAPRISLEASARVADGSVSLKAGLNAVSRELSFQGAAECDFQKLAPLFSTNSQPWLAQLSWKIPPRIEVAGQLFLPAWTNSPALGGKENLPGLSLAGRVDIGEGSYHGIRFNSASGPFALTNRLWSVAGLKLTFPEGSIEATGSSDERTRNFQAHVRSQIYPSSIKPLFLEKQQAAFDLVEFKTPPHLEGQVSGRWKQPELLSLAITLQATNFAVRGETGESCWALVLYTNQFFSILRPVVTRAGERGSAEGIGIDLVTQKLHLTNASGQMNPQAVARAIGKKAGEAVDPYRFDVPPMARASGVVDLKKGRHEDALRFEVNGGPFHWKNFHLSAASGIVDWQGQNLYLQDVKGVLHGGQVSGSAQFDFSPEAGTVFSFNGLAQEINLQPLLIDLVNTTNRIEGRLSGALVVTHANDRDPHSWQGHGRLGLRDGFIWEIPIFGVFSPVLNTFIPGLGNSRAKEATADFVITNSVIESKNLEIRATAMRMRYDMAVDFERRVDGRMEAELLRDIPAVGFFLSKLFWPFTKLFEYKVTGTLDQPKTQPLYTIPKILLMPLHPIKTFREMLPDDPKKPTEKPPQ